MSSNCPFTQLSPALTTWGSSHEVELPDADSVVPAELQCDIQPGALRQRYSVQWKQILNDNNYIIVNKGMFNLTLNVSSSLNGSQYQCEVTIDHDNSSVQIQSYDDVLITLVITTGMLSIIYLPFSIILFIVWGYNLY